MNFATVFAQAKTLITNVGMAVMLVEAPGVSGADKKAQAVALVDQLIEAIPGTSGAERIAKNVVEQFVPLLIDMAVAEANKLGIFPTSAAS